MRFLRLNQPAVYQRAKTKGTIAIDKVRVFAKQLGSVITGGVQSTTAQL